ncbi:hypothetical protein F4859DRAFT_526136 [Xylaria cf. heliscus]|nr:hypothetical protein F4859DRAFT_526136 [Xylaria cf. heliscus]
MAHVIYTFENAIDNFFLVTRALSSKIQCDEVVCRSDTLIAGLNGSKIIQFREHADLLDMKMLALAKDIHEDVVASCSELGAKCYSGFEYLAGALPDRFLPALFDRRYPVVLTHSDLNEMNILVNPCSRNITGLVDWSSASIQPFGFTFHAPENASGRMGSDGWKWFDNVGDLRGAFWRAFGEQTGLSEPQIRLIKVAGKAGILIRHGTAYNIDFQGMIGVQDPNAEDFKYLDAIHF